MSRVQFSVATFNVKNLVNAETNYYQKKDGSWNRYSTAAFDKKVDWLARQLVAMNADHVCLQEVFHQEALAALANRYAEIIDQSGLRQTPYSEIIHTPNEAGTAADPRPGLAYLGRSPVISHRQVQDLSADPVVLGSEYGVEYTLSATSRPLSIIEVDLGNGASCAILNAHLKSKRPLLERNSPADDPGNFMFLERAKGAMGSLVLRAGEALALRREILQLARASSLPVIVAGDLNDEVSAVTSDIVLGEAPRRFEQDAAIKQGFWDVELYSAARVHLRRSERRDFTTHIYNGHHSAIDHIFFSQEFYYRNGQRVGDLDYVQLFNDHITDRDFVGAPRNSSASDHGQLVAYFSLK